jgi:transposase-like protein
MSSLSTIPIPTLKFLQDIFFDEQECINFLFNKDILYKPQECINCHSKLSREAQLFRCTNRSCRKSVSILKDSFFAKNRIKCSDTMLIGYLWLCKATYTSIIQITGHSPNTISNYMKYFRELVTDTLEDDTTMIGGVDIVVEIDESKFGKRKYHRGHRVEGVWVLGGIERTEEKKCFIETVSNRSSETLLEVISRHVAPGSIVHTDLWKGYMEIENILNMTHNTVNHSQNFVDPNTGTHTNTIEGLWNGIKLRISPRNRNKDTIEDHLLEFVWRKKNKNDIWGGFINALKTTGYFE